MYDLPSDKSLEELKEMLEIVWHNYPKYNGGPFIDMVQKFADDNFYKYHFIARRYLEIVEEDI